MNDSRDFQDAESVRSGRSHVTSQPVSFPHPELDDMWRQAYRESPQWEGGLDLGSDGDNERGNADESDDDGVKDISVE